MLIYVTQSGLLRLCQQPDKTRSRIATFLEIQKINFKTQEHFQELKKEKSRIALAQHLEYCLD